ncbi:MAG: hypothetical protein IJZ75_03055 [Clostridia bacterium]|nr:hypothetical protein [Clostridia bacterium]
MKELSIIYLLQLAWKRLWALILAAVVCGAGVFCYCQFMAQPKYSATASVMVTNGAIIENNVGYEKVQATDISASLSLTTTVVDILETPDIYKELSSELNNSYTYRELMAMTTVERKGDETLMINVSVVSTSPEEAVNIVNAYVKSVPDYITGFVPYSHVKVSAEAFNANKIYPRTAQVSVLAAILGAAAVYLVFFTAERLNRAVDSENDFVTEFKIPLLGTVPDFEGGGNETYYSKGGSR